MTIKDFTIIVLVLALVGLWFWNAVGTDLRTLDQAQRSLSEQIDTLARRVPTPERTRCSDD